MIVDNRQEWKGSKLEYMFHEWLILGKGVTFEQYKALTGEEFESLKKEFLEKLRKNKL